MFLIIFSLALIILNIICFIKKKYLYLFIPCMLFLPEYYGIEFNSSLPLLTVTRMMFIIFYIYAFINKRRRFVINRASLHSLSTPYKLLIGYFFLRLTSNLYYFTTYGQAAKTFFLIIFEQAFLLIALYVLEPTKHELTILAKTIIATATIFFLIGIFESLTFIRPFDSLYTISRNVMNEHYIRLGLYRATTTFGMPGMYANMCILILPFIIYFYEKTKQRRYLISITLCILAIIHSGSRADLLYLPVIFLVYIFYIIRTKRKRLDFIKSSGKVLLSIFLLTWLLSAINPYYKYFYMGTCKSVLNEIGFNFDVNADSPSDNVKFGANTNTGTFSRTMQFSGLIHTAKINPIVGLGSGAQNRGHVQYYWDNGWHVVNSYDLGLVEIFCNEGAFGLLGVSLIIISFFMSCKKKYFAHLLLLTYLMTTLNTVNMFQFLLIYLFFVTNDFPEEG